MKHWSVGSVLALLLIAAVACRGTSGAALQGTVTASSVAPAADPRAPHTVLTYVSSYAGKIVPFSMDLDTGALTPHGEPVDAGPAPSFFVFSPDGAHLFAVNEADDVDGMGSGAVESFSIDAKSGSLGFVNRVSSRGTQPMHVGIDQSGRFVFVANYGSGSIAVFPVRADGALGDAIDTRDHGRDSQPHQVLVDASNHFLFATNKGRSDISQYRFDATKGELTPNTPAAVSLSAGSGPRHLAFHPTAPFAYSINRLDSTMTVLSFDAERGTFTPLQSLSTLPEGISVKDNACAGVVVAPSGRFVYGTNRGHDSIVVYAVDIATGRLTLVGHTPSGGRTPRSLTFDRSGRFLLVTDQGSDAVVSFEVDGASGVPRQIGSVAAPSPAFVGLLYDPPLPSSSKK